MAVIPIPTAGRSRSVRFLLATGAALTANLAIGSVVGLPRTPVTGEAAAHVVRGFGTCHTGGGTNCVVDGDTFWIDGAKIRIADIDAPETHPARCPEEQRLGNAAAARLRALLNAGPVELAAANRDTDHYGRKLRIVRRDGQSVGMMLVDEGLARRWGGRRQPWCDSEANL